MEETILEILRLLGKKAGQKSILFEQDGDKYNTTFFKGYSTALYDAVNVIEFYGAEEYLKSLKKQEK